jgi:DNA-binding FadR family transcriptional regulator
MSRAVGTSAEPPAGQPDAEQLRTATPRAADLIVGDLRGKIIRGDLQGDDSLPSENELMRIYGVSRPTLREALRVLEFEGWLTVRRGAKGGSTVHIPTGKSAARSMGHVLEHRGATLADVLEARSTIEPTCARLVAERGKKVQLLALTRYLSANPPDGGQPGTPSFGFHDLLVELAGNQTLILMYGMLRLVLAESTTGSPLAQCADSRTLQGRLRAHDAHQHLVDLIAQKDGDRAEEFWSGHLRNSHVARKQSKRTPLNFIA